MAKKKKKKARRVGPFEKYCNDMLTGALRSVSWPWPLLSSLTKALRPGTITILCGPGGSCKSFLLLIAAAFWHDVLKIPIAVYELEEQKTYHQCRYVAHRARRGNLANTDWVADHPDKARPFFNKYRSDAVSFGECLYSPPEEQPTLRDIADWVEEQAIEGKRVIIIDPITVVGYETSGRSWQEDSQFVTRIKRIAEKYRCSIILSIHPTKQTKNRTTPDFSQIAGGTSYVRASQTILWIQKFDHPIESKIFDGYACPPIKKWHSHKVAILKTRNGPGQGKVLAYHWNGSAFELEEVGIIVGKVKKKDQPDDQPPPDSGNEDKKQAEANKSRDSETEFDRK